MKHENIAALISKPVPDRRWGRRLRILLLSGAVLAVGGVVAVGVGGYYLVSATTAAVQSPEARALGEQALSHAESLSQGFSMTGCVEQITAHLDPGVWIDRPLAENLAALKHGCLGEPAATAVEPPVSTAT